MKGKPNLAKTRRNRRTETKGARGRPPKGYTHDPKSIPGLRDQARARAAARMGDCVELWELMVAAGITVLRAVLAGTPTQGESVSQSGALAGKVTTVTRNGHADPDAKPGDDGWTHETRTETHPYAGLEWPDVLRASENLADRGGLARKSELDVEATEIPAKLFRLSTYRTKDGARRELPPDTAGDSG